MLAGAIGTTVMDALWYLRYRRDGGTSGPLHWEFGGVDSWDDASAPGKVGKRLAEGFLQKPLSDKAAATTNNLVHWIYGLTWGAVYGIFAGSLRRQGVALGPVRYGGLAERLRPSPAQRSVQADLAVRHENAMEGLERASCLRYEYRGCLRID
jgi:hypothetical protein